MLGKINRLAERQLRVQMLQGDGGPGKALDQGALDGAQPIGATEIDIGDKPIECLGRASAAVELARRVSTCGRMHTKKAVRTLAAIMNEPRAPYAARVAAAEALLDRGWRKPRQSHEAEITHRYVIEIPALMDNATWEAEALEHEPDKLQ